MAFGPEALRDGIDAWMKEHGVEEFVVVMSDPDSDKFIAYRKGSVLWAVGACEYERDLIMHHELKEGEG